MYASIYQLGTHAIYADSTRSLCFLEKNGDTLMLDVHFKTYGITNLSSPSRAQAYLKGDALTQFIGDDTSATLKCALVYQSWIEPGEPLGLGFHTGRHARDSIPGIHITRGIPRRNLPAACRDARRFGNVRFHIRRHDRRQGRYSARLQDFRRQAHFGEIAYFLDYSNLE